MAALFPQYTHKAHLKAEVDLQAAALVLRWYVDGYETMVPLLP